MANTNCFLFSSSVVSCQIIPLRPGSNAGWGRPQTHSWDSQDRCCDEAQGRAEPAVEPTWNTSPMPARAVGKLPSVPPSVCNTTTPTEGKDRARQKSKSSECRNLRWHFISVWHRHGNANQRSSEAPTLPLTVLVATRQEPKGGTYFVCTSPDLYQKKTSITLDRNSTIHNSHTQAKFINSRACRRKDVRLEAVIHCLLFLFLFFPLKLTQPANTLGAAHTKAFPVSENGSLEYSFLQVWTLLPEFRKMEASHQLHLASTCKSTRHTSIHFSSRKSANDRHLGRLNVSKDHKNVRATASPILSTYKAKPQHCWIQIKPLGEKQPLQCKMARKFLLTRSIALNMLMQSRSLGSSKKRER